MRQWRQDNLSVAEFVRRHESRRFHELSFEQVVDYFHAAAVEVFCRLRRLRGFETQAFLDFARYIGT